MMCEPSYLFPEPLISLLIPINRRRQNEHVSEAVHSLLADLVALGQQAREVPHHDFWIQL